LIAGRALSRIGESWVNLGEYLKSQVVYLQARQDFPGGKIEEKAAYGMLLLAYNQDHYRYLEIEVKKFIKRFPDSSYSVPLIMLLLDLYQRQQRQGDLKALLAELESGGYPAEVKLEAAYRNFQLERRAGRKKAAAAICETLLERFPGSKYESDCRLFLARQAFVGHHYQVAGKWLGDLAESCSDPALRRRAQLLAGRIASARGDKVAARKVWLEVVSDRRSDAAAFTAFKLLARLCAGQGEIDKAVLYFDKASANPDHQAAARVLLEKVAFLEKAGRQQSALAAALRVSYLFPQQSEAVTEALFQAFRLAQAEKDKETAARVLQKLEKLKLSPARQEQLEKLKAGKP
jgi:outer membrane protein assembly factor BamD (BamD/ComL family)